MIFSTADFQEDYSSKVKWCSPTGNGTGESDSKATAIYKLPTPISNVFPGGPTPDRKAEPSPIVAGSPELNTQPVKWAAEGDRFRSPTGQWASTSPLSGEDCYGAAGTPYLILNAIPTPPADMFLCPPDSASKHCSQAPKQLSYRQARAVSVEHGDLVSGTPFIPSRGLKRAKNSSRSFSASTQQSSHVPGPAGASASLASLVWSESHVKNLAEAFKSVEEPPSVHTGGPSHLALQASCKDRRSSRSFLGNLHQAPNHVLRQRGFVPADNRPCHSQEWQKPYPLMSGPQTMVVDENSPNSLFRMDDFSSLKCFSHKTVHPTLAKPTANQPFTYPHAHSTSYRDLPRTINRYRSGSEFPQKTAKQNSRPGYKKTTMTCKVEGCDKGALYAYAPNFTQPFHAGNRRISGSQPPPTHCVRHKLLGMKNVKSKRCEGDEGRCEKIPSFGFEGQPPRFCVLHRLEGMSVPDGKRCEHKSCTKRKMFGFPGQQVHFCGTHREPGMTDLVSKRCEAPNCDHRPSFGFRGQKLSKYCRIHKEPGMINNKGKKCEMDKCGKVARFALQGEAPKRCHNHRTDEMVSVLTFNCSERGCYKNAVFSYPGENPSCCRGHYKAGMELALRTYKPSARKARPPTPSHSRAETPTKAYSKRSMLVPPKKKHRVSRTGAKLLQHPEQQVQTPLKLDALVKKETDEEFMSPYYIPALVKPYTPILDITASIFSPSPTTTMSPFDFLSPSPQRTSAFFDKNVNIYEVKHKEYLL